MSDYSTYDAIIYNNKDIFHTTTTMENREEEGPPSIIYSKDKGKTWSVTHEPHIRHRADYDILWCTSSLPHPIDCSAPFPLERTLVSFFELYPKQHLLQWEKETPLTNEEFDILIKHADKFKNVLYLTFTNLQKNKPTPAFIKQLERLAISCGRLHNIEIEWVSKTVFNEGFIGMNFRQFAGFAPSKNPCHLERILRMTYSDILPLFETLLSPYSVLRLRRPNWRGLSFDILRLIFGELLNEWLEADPERKELFNIKH
jgi:hypothetical protein